MILRLQTDRDNPAGTGYLGNRNQIFRELEPDKEPELDSNFSIRFQFKRKRIEVFKIRFRFKRKKIEGFKIQIIRQNFQYPVLVQKKPD